jgi:hypothetical protein
MVAACTGLQARAQGRVEVGDVRQHVGPQKPGVAVAVRRRRDVGDPVRDAEAGHGQRLAEVFRAGHAPHGVEAMDLAEEHRQHISRWFYDCPPAMHRALGEMYVADPRFTKTYEDMASGLAQWVKDAWSANAARQEG